MTIPADIRFANNNLKNSFYKLKKGIDSEKKLFKSINKALIKIKKDIFCGTQLRKKLIPEEYIQKYEIKNLWKFNLFQGWRLFYSVLDEEVIVVAIILEWLPHKEYEKKFKY